MKNEKLNKDFAEIIRSVGIGHNLSFCFQSPLPYEVWENKDENQTSRHYEGEIADGRSETSPVSESERTTATQLQKSDSSSAKQFQDKQCQFERRSNPGERETHDKGNGLPREHKKPSFARNDVESCQIQDNNQTSRHYEEQCQFVRRSNPGEREIHDKGNGLPRKHKKPSFARNDVESE